MKISVAMATYNGERFIRAQLDSLAAQTRPPDELIVVDDCSQDRTLEIVTEFLASAPFNVKIYRNAQNLGWSENFLKAISLCTGDWIALCDQDDVWMSTKLSSIHRSIGANDSPSDVVLWVHSARVADEKLRPSRVRYPNIHRRRVISGRQLPIWMFFPGFALVLRSDVVPLLGLFASQRGKDPSLPSLPMAHDRYICQIAKSVGSVGMLPDVLAIYRRHGHSSTTTFHGGNERVYASLRFVSLVKHSLLVGGADTCARRSQSAQCMSDVFGHLARSQQTRKWRELLLRAESHYTCYANWTAMRSHIYRERDAAVRLRYFLCALRERGYTLFYGLWRLSAARALAKDILVAIVGGHRIPQQKVGETRD